METRVFLSVRDRIKSIPYEAASRVAGAENHGFVPLKGVSNPGSRVPEAHGDESLLRAIDVLNAPRTRYFTIGCDRGASTRGNGTVAGGFLEFAINHVAVAADAQAYFKLFFDFSLHYQRQAFDQPVGIHWEIEPANFLAVRAIGYSVTVWIQTGPLPTEVEARTTWSAAVDFIVDFLDGHDALDLPVIYESPAGLEQDPKHSEPDAMA